MKRLIVGAAILILAAGCAKPPPKLIPPACSIAGVGTIPGPCPAPIHFVSCISQPSTAPERCVLARDQRGNYWVEPWWSANLDTIIAPPQ